MSVQSIVPSIVFIVPYRNRLDNLMKFVYQMKCLVDFPKYEIYISHQFDNRPFNRGGIKNIGFIAIRNKYPNHYKDITFVFNDVDTYYSDVNSISYDTVKGTVMHWAGFDFALGGIFSIKGNDFEISTGFPNFWGWGLEDNTLQDRCLSNGIKIDRSSCVHILDARIISTHHSDIKVISLRDSNEFRFKHMDSLNDIVNIKYDIVPLLGLANLFMINIYNFTTPVDYSKCIFKSWSVCRNRNKLKFVPEYRLRRNWNLFKLSLIASF